MALPPGIAGTKRPFDLPPASSVSNIDAIVVDDGITVRKATAAQIVENAVIFASQAQAEAGVDQTTYMNPLRTAEAIAAQALMPATLASNAGAGLVGSTSGQTVQDELDAIPTTYATISDLASTDGAGLIGTTSGQTVQDLLDAAVSVPFSVGTYVNPPLDDDEMIFTYTFAEDITFPADYAGSQATIIALPTAATTVILLRLPAGEDYIDTVPAGTITFNTDGSIVFLSEMNVPISFALGDALIALGPLTADATAAYSFTLIGAR